MKTANLSIKKEIPLTKKTNLKTTENLKKMKIRKEKTREERKKTKKDAREIVRDLALKNVLGENAGKNSVAW